MPFHKERRSILIRPIQMHKSKRYYVKVLKIIYSNELERAKSSAAAKKTSA